MDVGKKIENKIPWYHLLYCFYYGLIQPRELATMTDICGLPAKNLCILYNFFFLLMVRSILRRSCLSSLARVTLVGPFVFFPFVMSSVLCLFDVFNVIHQTC